MTAARTDGAAGLALVTAAGLGQILLCAWFGLLAWLSLGVTMWAIAHAYRRFGEGAWARERAALLERQLAERTALLDRLGRGRA
jgi:hypothetical protein